VGDSRRPAFASGGVTSTRATADVQSVNLLGGAVVTETVFSWPGVASFTVDSISNADYPVVQAAVVMLAALISLVNLGVDLSIGVLDPRITR